jgi:hypothetical protein
MSTPTETPRGRGRPQKSITVLGVTYDTAPQAAAALGMSLNTLKTRLRAGSDPRVGPRTWSNKLLDNKSDH